MTSGPGTTPPTSAAAAATQQPADTGLLLAARLLPVDRLLPNRFNPRRDYDADALTELEASMREHGFIGVLDGRELADGRIELAYGSRRLRAAMFAGIEAIPVIVRDWDDARMRFVALVENLSRQDLTPLEQAAAVGELRDAAGLSVRDLAARLGKPVTWVQDCLALHAAPDDVRDMVLARPDSLRHARHIARLEDEACRALLEELVLAEAITAAQVHEAVRAALAGVPLADALSLHGVEAGGDLGARPAGERRAAQPPRGAGDDAGDDESIGAAHAGRRRTTPRGGDPAPALARATEALARLQLRHLSPAALPSLLAELDALIERAASLRAELEDRCRGAPPQS
ncbi:MAG: ParB/RepB/Spo0J family partition protein [Anaerolineae bacterium]